MIASRLIEMEEGTLSDLQSHKDEIMAGATANRHRDLELRFPITQSLKVDSEDVMPKDEYLKSSRSASTRHRNT